MLQRPGGLAEYVVLKKSAPGAPRGRRQGTNAQNGVQQRLEGRIGKRAVAGRVMPPIVHEHVEGLEGLDVVPPESRNENRISRAKLSHMSRRQCLAKFGVAHE